MEQMDQFGMIYLLGVGGSGGCATASHIKPALIIFCMEKNPKNPFKP